MIDANKGHVNPTARHPTRAGTEGGLGDNPAAHSEAPAVTEKDTGRKGMGLVAPAKNQGATKWK